MDSSSSSSSTARVMKKYDVFISFRGEDTRRSFTGFLHGLLCEAKLNVFIDNELQRGDEISTSLMNAIEESTVSVIIFSAGYASSRWCLEELVKIIECKNMFNHIVVPVFYHVDPSDITNQTGNFGDGFANLVQSFNMDRLERLQMTEEQFQQKVQKWRNALTEAAQLSGYTLTLTTVEFDILREIANEILEMINYFSLSDDDNKGLVGIEPIIHYIIQSLLTPQSEMENVLIFGIWGMGGIGKTTIAEAVFNKIRTHFEASYFALNVREKSSSHNTLTLLKQELLSSMANCQRSIRSSTFTKRRLGCKKVFIVFDDVTSYSQVEYLIGDLRCLGPGSRIIITTRDKQVLRNCEVKERYIYMVEGLSHCEALQLFSRHAFKQNHPRIDYNELSNRVVQYAQGVPLALKVLGSFLMNKPEDFWESEIKKLEIIPHKDIQQVLKVSYDGLDDKEKNIFLDIAFFLKWENKDFAIDFLDACQFHAKVGISVLIDKCLITISNDNKITMHDLLQEMGWEIVRCESTKDPGERSRLWYHEDIYNVLEENTGTKAIEGICLDMSKQIEILNLQPHALEMMRRLRFFKLYNSCYEEDNINKVHVLQGLDLVSRQISYFCWHGCPLKSLPTNHLKNLVALDMPYSKIEQLRIGTQLVMLKRIDLSCSKYLRKIQGLSLAPNLGRLILEDCTSLVEISPFVQDATTPFKLDLSHCKNLHNLLPPSHLESRSKVFLSDGSNHKDLNQKTSCSIEESCLDDFAIDNLSGLVILNLKNCAMLESLPSNICKLKFLEHLNLSGCSKLDRLLDSLGNLEALKELNLTSCYIKKLPKNLGQLSSLELLFLGRNNFESIPISIVDLSKLSYLDLSYCERLQFLPELPCTLKSIDAHNCISVEALSRLLTGDTSQSSRHNYSNCFKLVDQNAFQEIIKDAFQENERLEKSSSSRSSACVCFPGNEIPEWFILQSTGSSVTFNRSRHHFNGKLTTFLVCAVVEFQNYHNEGKGLVVGFECTLQHKNITKLYHGTLRGWDCGTGPDCVDSHHVFLGFDFSSDFSDPWHSERSKVFHYTNKYGVFGKITIQFYVENLNAESVAGCRVIKCGLWAPALSTGSVALASPKRLKFFTEGESS